MLIYNKNSPRTTDAIDLFNYPNKKHRYLVGRGNIVDVLTLSKPNHIYFLKQYPYTALFLSSQRKIHSVIDNGMRGGVIKSLFSTKKRNIPSFLGGFKTI